MCSTPDPLDHLLHRLGLDGSSAQCTEAADRYAGAWADAALYAASRARPQLFSSVDVRQSLEALRILALICQERHERFHTLQRELGYAWVRALINPDASSRYFFLQRYRVCDQTFYRPANGDAARNLEPRRRPWPNGWDPRFQFVRNPEQLTVTELELALAIFNWSAGAGPTFVWWVRDEPHLLWRVHRFLLRRYAFYLLGFFETALHEAGLNHPPFRAGEGLFMPSWRSSPWVLSPRLFGLTVLGYIGLTTVDPFVAFVFTGPVYVVGTAGVVAACVGWRLYSVNVFKQNRGVLANASHARPRIFRAFILAVAWSAILAVGVAGLWYCLGLTGKPEPDLRLVRFPDGSALGNLVVPYVGFSWSFACGRTVDMAVRWIAMAATAIVVGAIVQWFWQDESAIEPI